METKEKALYEAPKVSSLNENKSAFGGFDDGKCEVGSNANGGCMSGTGVGEIDDSGRHCVSGTDGTDLYARIN